MEDTSCSKKKKEEYVDCYPIDLKKLEKEMIEERRKEKTENKKSEHIKNTENESVKQSKDTERENSKNSEGEYPKNTVGFALSGGGIRSATFCLGIFQALANSGLLKKVDYLSTVSGGGYFGSFLGKLFQKKQNHTDVEEALIEPNSPEIKWLREHSRYLAPNGSGDLLIAITSFIRNFLALHLIIGTMLTLVFLLTHLPTLIWEDYSKGFFWKGLWLSPHFPLMLIPLYFISLPAFLTYWMIYNKGRKALLLLFIFSLFIISLITNSFVDSNYFFTVFGLFFLITIGFLIFILFRSSKRFSKNRFSQRNTLTRRMKNGLIYSLAICGVALIDSLGHMSYLLWVIDGGFTSFLAGSLPLLFIIGFGKRILAFIGARSSGRSFRGWASIASILAATLVATAICVFYSGISHRIAWDGNIPKHDFSEKVLMNSLETEKWDPAKTLYPIENKPLINFYEETNISFTVTVGKQFNWIKTGLFDTQIEISQFLESVPWQTGKNSLAIYQGILISLLGCLCFGWIWSLLNLTSQHSFYQARLARAYLGAANPKRTKNQEGVRIQDPDDDDIDHEQYIPHNHGGPLHLLNVTINETIDGHSNIQQQDRRGTGLAVGPHGLSVGAHHHHLLDAHKSFPKNSKGYCVFPDKNTPLICEKMKLSRWVAISGAAVSTGLGSRSNISLSILAGLANVRLGYWWDSGIDPRERNEPRNNNTDRDQTAPKGPAKKIRALLQRIGHVMPKLLKPSKGNGLRSKRIWQSFYENFFPVQHFILREFLSRFTGTAFRHWYLSDGAHFEELGAYELIRRRLDLMVVVDASADPDYKFNALGNFIRKARTDFGAQVDFLDHNENEPLKNLSPCLGTLVELRPKKVEDTDQASWQTAQRNIEKQPLAAAYAACARVTYNKSEQKSLLIYIKPTVIGNEPLDIINYRSEHPSFPQESTLDQFFDEAQWESYRALGKHIGQELFGHGDSNRLMKFLDCSKKL